MVEVADNTESPDGLSILDEMTRREDRLTVIAEAKAEIERRVDQRYQQEQAVCSRLISTWLNCSENMPRRASHQVFLHVSSLPI